MLECCISSKPHHYCKNLEHVLAHKKKKQMKKSMNAVIVGASKQIGESALQV